MNITIISLVAFVAAILTFFSGFGLGTILTPVLAIFKIAENIPLTESLHLRIAACIVGVKNYR